MFANKPKLTDSNRAAANDIIRQAIEGYSAVNLNKAFEEAQETGHAKLWVTLFPHGGHAQSLYKLYRYPQIPALYESFIKANPVFRELEKIIERKNCSVTSVQHSFYGDDIIIKISSKENDNAPHL